MTFHKKIYGIIVVLSLFNIIVCFGAENTQPDDHPTRWIYEAMNAWDQVAQTPANFGRTGKGVGIAVIEGPNFNLHHPAFAESNITLIDFGGDNLEKYDNNRASQYHANHVTALIAGKLNEPYSDLDVEFVFTFKKDNPKLVTGYPHLPHNIPWPKYYAGLASNAKVYAYPRKLETDRQDLGTLLKIFEDIGTKEDIRLINLSCKLEVNPSIIKQVNRLAERGIIFVQATGNDGFDLDNTDYKKGEAIQYLEGASYNDFSSIFWTRHIFVGALSCYKSPLNKVQAERWKDSSYYVKRDTPHTKNFIMAPGSCIFSASKTGYDLKSGTSMATAFVTGALACALERPRAIYVPEVLIDHLLSFAQTTNLAPYKESNVPFLDVKRLIEADHCHEQIASSYFPPLIGSLLDHYQGDHPTRWVYEAMGAWDKVNYIPHTNGYTGSGIGVAIIGAPYFNLDHPSLKNSSITVVNTHVSFVKYSENRGHREVPAYLGFEPPALIEIGCLKIGRQPALKEPERLPFNFLVPNEPRRTKYKYKGENTTPWKGTESRYWHSNHTLALIVGKLGQPYLEEICPYSLLPYIKENNPKLEEVSYPQYRMRDIAYYGGLAPNAKAYAYPRDIDGSTYILSAILDNIAHKDDIRLINLNCQIDVNSQIIQQMNLLAEKGKIFIQAAGNAGKNLDLEENAHYRTIQCVENSSLADFSPTFWDHYIPVGALACYKTAESLLGLDIWKGSSYSLFQNPQFKNFILAPGACIVSASYDEFYCDSNTRIAAAFVTGVLACALEARSENQSFDHLIRDLLKEKYNLTTSSDKHIAMPILNIKNLVS